MRYTFGDYVLDTQRAELQRAGAPIKLRRQVFQVLAYLLAHRDRVVSKQELLEQLWPDQFVGDEALKSCLKAVRKALEDSRRPPRFLRTLYGQGYRFVAAVEVLEPLPADAIPHALAPHSSPFPEAEGAHEPERQQFLPVGIETLEGEHKQVTVLCGALVEASIRAEHLGAEAMYHLMRDVLALVQNTVQRYEGTLLQVSGAGFVALFGAPVAHEDHARRAVLAALELRQRLRVPEVLRGAPHGMPVCLGLHTGPVVVGPLEHDPQRLYTAGGDTLAQATRLQQQAGPDTLLVSAATYGLVQAEVQGEVWAAGPGGAASPPVVGYVVHGLLRRWAGVPRRGGRPLSRFVGRARELALLHERLAQAARGQGQVVGMVGEPGLGKSRLLVEFAHRLAGQAVTYCEGHCLAYGSATPYLPVRDLLRQLWGLPDAAPAPTSPAAVRQRLHEAGVVSEDDMLVLLQVLDVPVDLAPVTTLSPLECKARTFAVLRHLIRHASQQQPLLLAVENLHWCDPTSNEWLATLVEQLGEMPVLLLATYRPGYQPPWIRHSVATQMALPRLSPCDSLAVLQSVPQAAQFPVALQQAIVAKAAGNPFFVEELTWTALAHGDHASPLPLPDTIEAVLASRLDRLPREAKRLVQIASVIGPEVSMPLLQAIADRPKVAVQGALVQLQTAEFLYETRLFPEHVYTFKHALTHEVAYESLLQERRRVLHARIVEALETLYPDRLDEQVERLAHHALRGEVWDKALAYGRQTGEKALARSAYREALASFEQALGALRHLPETRDMREQAIDLLLDLRQTYGVLEGQPERRLQYLQEAETLAETLDDPCRLGRVSSSMANYFAAFGPYDRAIAYGQRALALAAASGDIGTYVKAHNDLGLAYFHHNDYRQAMHYTRQAMAILQGERCYEFFGQNRLPAVFSRTYLCHSLGAVGGFAEGIAIGAEGLRLAEVVNHPRSLVTAYLGIGGLYVRQGELHQALSVLERALGLCQEAELRWDFSMAAECLSSAYVLSGRVDEAVQLLERAIGTQVQVQRLLSPLSEAYLLAGRLEEASTLADRVFERARTRKQRGYEAYALRLLGDIAVHREPPPECAPAASYYQQALALAEELGMRPLQAHCHRGLGALYARSGQREQARSALVAAIALYRAMEMTFWLPPAEAALVQVDRG